MIDAEILTVGEDFASERIDKFLSVSMENMSRSAAQKLIDDGNVRVNFMVVTKNYKVKAGDKVAVVVPEPKILEAKPENIPLDIRYEDGDLLVVNKPKGMVVHPAAGNYDGTLVNALLYHCKGSLSGIGGVIRPGIVHRIDKDSSGLLIVAKNDNSHKFLAEQIKAHSFKREYKAICSGAFKNEEGTIDAPIGRHPIKRKQMAVTDKNSKNAVTHYKVLERFKKHTYLSLRLETGRTHQIRVHTAYLGKPVFNDPVYGGRDTTRNFEGQCLHAGKIGFVHPNGSYLEFESELPEYFKNQLEKLRKSEK